jgi:hypothetical protein
MFFVEQLNSFATKLVLKRIHCIFIAIGTRENNYAYFHYYAKFLGAKVRVEVGSLKRRRSFFLIHHSGAFSFNKKTYLYAVKPTA